ncbi:hypothetical protein Z043_122224, partial [Scleropages formosus]
MEALSIFGPQMLGGVECCEADGPGFSKADFMEKVRQSNDACQQGKFSIAVRLYSDALLADPQNFIIYSNRSAAHLKLGQYQAALKDADKAQHLNPKWPKCLTSSVNYNLDTSSGHNSMARGTEPIKDPITIRNLGANAGRYAPDLAVAIAFLTTDHSAVYSAVDSRE